MCCDDDESPHVHEGRRWDGRFYFRLAGWEWRGTDESEVVKEAYRWLRARIWRSERAWLTRWDDDE